VRPDYELDNFLASFAVLGVLCANWFVFIAKIAKDRKARKVNKPTHIGICLHRASCKSSAFRFRYFSVMLTATGM
jgi:hypothetical protein